MDKVKCNEETLKLLLADIDRFSWDDIDGMGMYFEIRKIGEGISGGMVTSELWLHPAHKEKGYDAQIKDVIEGRIEKINF